MWSCGVSFGSIKKFNKQLKGKLERKRIESLPFQLVEIGCLKFAGHTHIMTMLW